MVVFTRGGKQNIHNYTNVTHDISSYASTSPRLRDSARRFVMMLDVYQLARLHGGKGT